MSSRLLTSKKFNRRVGYQITLPWSVEDIGTVLAVVVLKNQTVQLYGPIEHEQVCVKILQAGMARLTAHHHPRPAVRLPAGVAPTAEQGFRTPQDAGSSPATSSSDDHAERETQP